MSLSHHDIEVTERSSVANALNRLNPNLVINTAAYHKVDVVEENPNQAFAVNTTGVRNLALQCQELDAVLIHISTDYVFSGTSHKPYVESDPVAPVNVYGASKAAGEMLLRYLWPKHFIVRTSGLYGVAGSSGKRRNFVELMLELASLGKPIRVVSDQVLTPTGTRPLVQQLAALSRTATYGTYHATCNGECSWYGFALEIFRQCNLKPNVSPQTTVESLSSARRPAYSVLDNNGLRAHGIDVMPDWKESLAQYLDLRTRTHVTKEAPLL